MVKLTPVLGAVAILATALSAFAGDCGLNLFAGRTGETLQFWVIQGGDPPARFAWPVGAAEAWRRTIPERSVPGRPGSGSRAWAVIRDAVRPAEVAVFEVQPDGAYRPVGRIDVGALPLAFTWAEDASGTPWLLFDTRGHGVSVFRREREAWTHVATVEGELTAPRAVGDEIRMNGWAFVRNAAARKLALPAAGEFTWFGGGDAVIAVSTSLRMWSSDDDGKRWRELPAPAAPSAPSARPALVWSDGEMPVVSWSAGSALHVARWSGHAWEDLATIDKRAHDAAGPVIVIGRRVIAFAVCDRTTATEATIATPAETRSFPIAMRPPG